MTGKPLVILSGATGVGKTALSVGLAERINGEIISADSMQVYKHFDIGTAKTTKAEMGGITHYLIDILDGNSNFNIYEFKKYAESAINTIYDHGKIPIIVGGTGFYIQSVLYDIDFSDEDSDLSYRNYLENAAAENGCEFVHELLKTEDPDAAAQIHPNNVKRVIRALEFKHKTGKCISEHNREMHDHESSYNFAYFVLNRKRELIYDRIDKRVDKMIAEGLTDEVRGLLANGISKDSQSMQGIGYKEIIPYIDGKITLEEAVSQLKLNTRHFAKRQITWFKREKDVLWINYEDFKDEEEMICSMSGILKEKGIINV